MVEIIIPMKPLSVNHMYGNSRVKAGYGIKNNKFYKFLRNGKKIKLQATHDFESEFANHLLQYGSELSDFLKLFDPKKNVVIADFEFYFPESQYYKKDKAISSRIGDLDNYLKSTIDCLFKNLMNDHFITELTARKLPTKKDEPYFKIILELDKIPNATD